MDTGYRLIGMSPNPHRQASAVVTIAETDPDAITAITKLCMISILDSAGMLTRSLP